MNINRYFVLLSIICFLISLNQSVFFDSPDSREHTHGLIILALGWAGIFRGSLISISWLANPALILSWVNFKKLNISFKYSIVSFFFTLFFLIYDWFAKDIQYSNYNIGVCFWILSVLIMLLGNFQIKSKIQRG